MSGHPELHFLLLVDEAASRVEVEGPFDTPEERDTARVDDEQLPIDLDPTPHPDNVNRECLLVVVGVSDDVLDVAGPYEDEADREVAMRGYAREGELAVALDVRSGTIVDWRCVPAEDGELEPVDLPVVQGSTDDEPDPLEAWRLAQLRAKRAQDTAEPDAAAFEVIEGIEGKHYIFGWERQIRTLLELVRADAARVARGEPVKERRKVELFVTSDLGLRRPEQVVNPQGRGIAGAYLGVVHEAYPEPTIDAIAEADGAFDFGWETFAYSNGRRITLSAKDVRGRRIATRPVPIPLLESIASKLASSSLRDESASGPEAR